MGNSNNLLSPDNHARMVAAGRKYMTHAQAIVHSFPSSQMSDAEKEYWWLEENPVVAGTMLKNSFRPYEVEMFKDMIALCPLGKPDRPHHYRGYAERIPPDTPHAEADAVAVADESESESAAASTCDSSSAHSSRRDGPAHPELATCDASPVASSSSLSPRAAEPAADCALDEERVSLLAKKRQ